MRGKSVTKTRYPNCTTTPSQPWPYRGVPVSPGQQKVCLPAARFGPNYGIAFSISSIRQPTTWPLTILQPAAQRDDTS